MKIQIGHYEFACLQGTERLPDKPGVYVILHNLQNDCELVDVGERESLMDLFNDVDLEQQRQKYPGTVLLAVCYTEFLSSISRRSIVNSIVKELDGEPKIGTVGISENQIAELAYKIWQDNGCLNGHDVDDWLTAQDQLSAAYCQQNQPVAADSAKSSKMRVAEYVG